MRLIFAAVAIAAPLPAQEPAISTRTEWVLLVNPRVPVDGPVSIAPQRFATDQDCKALASQLHASVQGKCVKVTVIAPPAPQ